VVPDVRPQLAGLSVWVSWPGSFPPELFDL
jgi:hypothetical protein